MYKKLEGAIKMKKLIIILLCIMMMASLIVGCGSKNITLKDNNNVEASEPITLKLGHMTPLEHNYNYLAEKFKKLVEEKSEGRIIIEIYPQAQLGYDRELLESMQFGNLDLAVTTSAPISNFEAMYGVLDLPYLFQDWDHLEAFIQSKTAQNLMTESMDNGLVGLSIMPRGFRSVTNNVKPINTPEDLKGIKFRVLESPAYVKTFEDFESVVSAMSWGEVYTALQQGAIDGQENPPETVKAERVYEVQEFYSLTEHIAGFAAIMGSSATWNKLSSEDQELIRESAIEAAILQGKENRAKEEKVLEELSGLGLKINRVDKSLFAEKATSAYQWFEEKNGKKYIDEIKALK